MSDDATPDPDALALRNTLIERVDEQYDDLDEDALPVATLEEYFEGNWDEQSFAPAVADEGRPPLADCYQLLQDIREYPEVQDVLVTINEVPDLDEPDEDEIWPVSEAVYVLTSVDVPDVKKWVAALKPTEVNEGWSADIKPPAAPDLDPEMQVIAVWWD